MLTAMFVLAIIALVFFGGAVAATFVVGSKHQAVAAFGLVAVLVMLALSVLAVIAFFVGV